MPSARKAELLAAWLLGKQADAIQRGQFHDHGTLYSVGSRLVKTKVKDDGAWGFGGAYYRSTCASFIFSEANFSAAVGGMGPTSGDR